MFFSNSGSVAVEVAMKMAMQYWLNRGVRGRTRFLAFKGGYHGDTIATMAVCDPEEGMHALFAGVLPRSIIVVDLPRDEESIARASSEFLERHADEIAGIIVEPLVQGAGGMVFHDDDVLRRLRAAADRYGLLLIFDEIFTGFGRTGTMFACEAAGVAPDIVTLVKGTDRRHDGAGGDDRQPKSLRCLLVRRSGPRADARADLYGQRAWPAPQPTPRSICSSARPRLLQSVPRFAKRLTRRPRPLPWHFQASGTCGCAAPSASSSWSESTI